MAAIDGAILEVNEALGISLWQKVHGYDLIFCIDSKPRIKNGQLFDMSQFLKVKTAGEVLSILDGIEPLPPEPVSL